MEINKNISAPFQGMNRDSNLDRLQDGEFTFALNSDSNGRVRHNEPSNYLYTIFPEGYKVISEPLKDLLNRRTFYWLTNPETTFSSFGYVIDKKTFHDNYDQEDTCTTCDPINKLSAPLEDTEQTPEFEYVELFHDRCLPIGEGLNLHIDYPIKSPVLKTELSGTTVYWEDSRNLPRYVKVDDISYLYEKDIPCEDSQTTDCLQVDKLLQFPYSTPIEVESVSQDTGGNLRRGSYQIFVAYSDEFGAEMSNYSTGSNIVKIFDINNSILEDRDLDNTTNYSIRVKVNNLDYNNFKYYKVVVVERGVLDSTAIAYEEDILPTTVSEFSITSSGRLYTDTDRDTLLNPKKTVELNTLFNRRPIVEKADGEAIIGNRKYMYGVKRKETVNIQPIVNLFSTLAEWQTVFAKDTLYEDGVNASKYGSYMRDEVEPFSLRLINKDGSKSDNFLMISRPPNEEDLEEVSEDKILEFSESGCKDTNRIYKWQYENTAKVDGQCELNIETIEVSQNDVRNCLIENVFTIPANEVTIELESDFTTLQDYIDENPDLEIPGVTSYLEDEYEGQHCRVSFGTGHTSGILEIGKKYIIYSVNEGDDFSNVGYTTNGEIFVATNTTPISWVNGTEVEETFCDVPELTNYNVEIAEVINEVVTKQEAEFPDDYSRIASSNSCNIYSRGDDGGFIRDNDFAWEFDSWSTDRRLIYQRDYSFFNESCPTSEYIQWVSAGGYLQRYWFNYIGGINREDLETNKRSENDSTDLESDGVSGFSSKIASGSLWYVGDTGEKNKFVLEVTKAPDPSKKDNLIRVDRNPQQKVRISIFNRCSDQEALFSKVHLIANKNLQLLVEVGDSFVKIVDDLGVEYTYNINNPFPSNRFYVVVEPYIVKTEGKERGQNEEGEEVLINNWIDKVRTAPPNGCFSIALRDVEYTSATVSWDGIILNKLEEYTASCNYQIPKDLNCDPIPYQKGRFAYWESTHTYPDNAELYNSSNLKINPSHLNFHPYTLRQRFEEYFAEGFDQEGNYILKGADFRCKPIRHFKFPDNRIVPFTNSINLPNGSDSFIYPMGITLDSRVVQSMLVVALENKLITQDQYDNVVGFEVLKGDNLYSRSVVGNGILFDMYKYQDKGEDIYYSNFPYNGLGDDLFHREMTSDNNIKHPFNSRGNNKFTFISPDLLHTSTSLPNELSIQGYLRGHSNSTFVELEDHAKWTILGRKARRTANTLAWAEFAVEAAISIGTTTSNQWFMVGLAGGTSLGLVGTAIVTAANLASGYSKIGEYRYQWLETFKNLGAKYNFGYYGYSKADYSTFLKNRDNKTILNKLSVNKYLPSGYFDVLDKGSKDTYKINNYLRERSIFLSTGDKVIDYSTDYYQIDISTNSRFSGTTSGRVDCQNSFTSSVASPYATLKNYVPDQHGEIGSISWVPTGKQYYFGRDNRCEPTFGGDVTISRFYYRRKMPLFTNTAYKYPDKTTFEYSSKFNVARAKYYVDYETDTEYNDLLIPFPDIDSEYHMDCQSPNSRFYIKRGKIYTAYYSFPGFLVESRMNLNWRYGGRELKDQFYPLETDIEKITQEKNVGIVEQEKILYKETYSLGNLRANTTVLPYSYDREFYKKLSNNTNEVLWSQVDVSESSRTQDPYLVYKPLDKFNFDTKNGLLKSLKEATTNTAIARFTNNMQVFNTIDVLAEKLTPQTKDLGTGGIFAQSRPVSFINSPLGFSGTQHFNVVSTEFGDIHIDSERGQIMLLNNQANGLEDIAYGYQGMASNMNRWFKKHLPFKIKNYFPEADTDNPFKGLGISGGYDAVNKRAFITKLDYEPISDCVEYDSEIGLVVNETKCNEAPQVPICPEGYEFNTVTNKCERVLYNSPCPIGYTYSPGGEEEVVTETCTNPIDIVFIIDATFSQDGVINNIKNGISTDILPSIISQFGEDYRLGLVVVKDRRESGNALFDILEPMSIGNIDTFIGNLSSVVASGGTNAAEPYDLALEAVLDNTREIDLNRDFTSNTLTIGQFREEASKVVVITTDNPPSSNIDNFTWDVWEETQNIVEKAVEQEVQIFTYFTPVAMSCINLPLVAPTNPVVPFATPCTNNQVRVTPYAPYVLNYMADTTGGQYSVNQNGQGISSDLSEKIEQSISCTSNTETIIIDSGCIQDGSNNNCITDIVFVVDRSGSISSLEMTQQKDFLKEIINNMQDKLESLSTQVGIVTFGTQSQEVLALTSNINDIIIAIDSIPNNNLGQSTNSVAGMCHARSVLNGLNGRVNALKQVILITDGRASSQIYNCSDATDYLFPLEPNVDLELIKYGAKLKSEGIYITTVALGSTCERLGVLKLYGGDKTEPNPNLIPCSPSEISLHMGTEDIRQSVWNSEYYPLSSLGNGLFGYSTYQSNFENAVNIAYDIANTTCQSVIPIDCGDCEFDEDLHLCVCKEETDPDYVDYLSPADLTNSEYFRDVSWTIAFKFEDKGWNSYHSFTPNFYNPHQDFFQTGFNSNSSKLWSHTLEDNSFQVFQGQRKPFIVETVITNKNTSKYLNSIAIESEAIRYQDGVDSSQWWDKGFDTLTIYNNTDNSGRLKLTPLKNYRDLTKYPINNPNNTQTITFVPQDEKHLVNYFYNRTRREDRNIPQWIYDRNQIMKDINPKVVKFTGKQLLERLRGNSFIIRLENESESRFKINLKDVITEQTNY